MKSICFSLITLFAASAFSAMANELLPTDAELVPYNRTEMLNGEPVLVADYPEAKIAASAEKRGKGKYDITLIVMNATSDKRMTLYPDDLVVLFQVDGNLVPGDAMTAREWAKKQRSKGMWLAMAAGLANHASSRGNQPVATGTYSSTDGTWGTVTVKESHQVRQQRAVEKSIADGARIGAAAEAAGADAARAETLSPGEVTGGTVHLRKMPKGADTMAVEVPLGGKLYLFTWDVTG